MQRLASKPVVSRTIEFLRSGWGADAMYSMVIIEPYRTLARWLRHEPVDDIGDAITGTARITHHLLSLTQTGRLRTYAAGMVLGTVLLILAWMWS